MTIGVGDRVRYKRMDHEWGIGELRAVAPDGKMIVMFARGGQRKLPKDADLEKLEGEAALDPRLDALPRAKSPKKVRPGGLTPPFEHLKQDFIRRFPGGFDDPDFLAKERDYKLAAREKFQQSLNREALASLVEVGDFAEVRRRSERAVINVIDHHESMGLQASTKEARNAERYARALYEVLYGDADFQVRFERWTDILARLDGAKWPIVTYFPFIAFPTEQMFLKPQATQYVARSCDFELNYSRVPNWHTYESLLRLTLLLKDKLADLNPKDHIDLQSFVWFVWKKDDYSPRSGG